MGSQEQIPGPQKIIFPAEKVQAQHSSPLTNASLATEYANVWRAEYLLKSHGAAHMLNHRC